MVVEHYLWDRLEEAHNLATHIGVGLRASYVRMYRTVEAEYRTRERGVIENVNEWLSVERIRDETDGATHLVDGLLRGITDVSGRLGCDERFPTRVAVMAIESDAPWTDGRAGYAIGKHPFDKICVPNQVVFDAHQLARLMVHEYSHVISRNLSEGRVPRWLNEAVAVAMEGRHDQEMRSQFARGEIPWLDEHELQLAFHAEDEGATDYEAVHRAYAQAGWIGAYLTSLGGEHGLGDLLRGFANNTELQELWMLLRSQEHVEEAVREVFHVSVKELFSQALAWLKAGGGAAR
jgi:hypothetical protein